MTAATRKPMMKLGTARSRKRKLLFSGSRENTESHDEYKRCDKSRNPSGEVASNRMIDW